MDAGAGEGGVLERRPDLDPLDGLNAHHRLGEAPVEATIPLGVAAQAHRHAEGRRHHHATEGIARRAGGVDGRAHRVRGGGVGAGDVGGEGALQALVQRQVVEARPHAANRLDVAAQPDADVSEERPADRPHRHARGGLASAGALGDEAQVVQAILDRAGQVGVAGAGPAPGGHDPVTPVLPVAVGDLDRHGGADGHAVHQAAGDLGMVALDALAAAAAVAPLAAAQVAVYLLGVQRQAGGEPIDDGGEGGPVGLAGGHKAQHVILLPGRGRRLGPSRPPVRRRPSSARTPRRPGGRASPGR